MVHESDGKLGAMENDLRSILAQDPDHAATLNALGYTLTNRTQRYEEAADLIERALALSPGDPAILDSLGWVYYKLGQYSASERCCGCKAGRLKRGTCGAPGSAKCLTTLLFSKPQADWALSCRDPFLAARWSPA
jgi:tetratricopeptide (TPR) repeat protein